MFSNLVDIFLNIVGAYLMFLSSKEYGRNEMEKAIYLAIVAVYLVAL